MRDLSIGFLSARRAFGLSRSADGDRPRVIAGRISFSVQPGQSLVLLGPNGAGKTTLLKTVLGLWPSLGGDVLLDGRSLRDYGSRERACAIGYVPQTSTFEFSFRVRDVVAMGRAPRLGLFGLPTHDDDCLAEEALDRVGIGHLADAYERELSGGEQRLVLIARALAQETRFLLLDEPTANLDYGNQKRVLTELARLARSGLGVIMTSHSPGHAFVAGTHAALLDRGGGFTVGSVAEIVTEERLAQVYGLRFRVVSLPADGDGEGGRACVPELGGGAEG